jgi:colicin import membrane protein
LLAFLVIGISWNNSTPSGVEVELWDSAPQVVTKPEPELKTVMKEEAADIAVKKKEVEKEPPKKIEPPKALSPAETKANAAAEKVRADQLARLRAAAGAEGGSSGKVGSGVGSGGSAPPGWTDKVIKKVKPLIVFNPESVSGNPAAVIQVNLAPDGAILSTSVLTSSGNPSWDRAVLLALSRAESLPKDDNGKIPQREVKLTFKPKD